jgi:hypothetical protein
MSPSPSIHWLSTSVKRRQIPREWPLGPMGRHHVEAPEWRAKGRFDRPVGWADPLWAPLRVCIIWVAVLRALRLVPGVHVFLSRFRHSSGPMGPCEVHVSRSDSSGLASLGLATCLALIGSEVVALSWFRWRGMNHRIWVCYFFCTYFPATTRSPRTIELHYS